MCDMFLFPMLSYLDFCNGTRIFNKTVIQGRFAGDLTIRNLAGFSTPFNKTDLFDNMSKYVNRKYSSEMGIPLKRDLRM